MILTAPHYQPLGFLKSANMNSTVDQTIYIGKARYIVRRITVANVSLSLTTAAGGVYTGASKTGTTLVANTQVYTALTGSGKYLDLTIAVTADIMTSAQIYFALTTGQGAAATADVYVYGEVLTI